MEVGLELELKQLNATLRGQSWSTWDTITREGLRTNPTFVEAVKEFPVPKNVHEVWRFHGLASYYRRFIRNFASVATPLHHLTRKDAKWLWTPQSFQQLKDLLTTAPVLVYPKFNRDYVLETDASTQGLGVMLSKQQEERLLHPVAYASRALTQSKRNYGITELETLRVAWAVSHFEHFLYANSVTIYQPSGLYWKRQILLPNTHGGALVVE